MAVPAVVRPWVPISTELIVAFCQVVIEPARLSDPPVTVYPLPVKVTFLTLTGLAEFAMVTVEAELLGAQKLASSPGAHVVGPVPLVSMAQ